MHFLKIFLMLAYENTNLIKKKKHGNKLKKNYLIYRHLKKSPINNIVHC